MFRSTARSRCALRHSAIQKMRRQDFRSGGDPPASQGHIQVQNCECWQFNNKGNELLFRLGDFVVFPLTKDWTIFPLSHWAPYLFLHTLLPWWLGDKEPACNAGGPGLVAGWGRSPGEGNGSPLQSSCLEMPWTEELGGLQSKGSQS